MKLNHFLTIHGVIYLVFGLGLLAVPAPLVGLYGLTGLDASGILLARLQAPFLIGIGVMSLIARNTDNPSSAAYAILVGLGLANAISAVITLIANIAGLFNVLGWSDPVLFVVLAAGCGHFLVGNRGARQASPA